MSHSYHKFKKNDKLIINFFNYQKQSTNHKATQKRMPQTNNMSSFTKQIITAANQINGIKRNNSSIQYFASRKLFITLNL